MEEFKDVTTIQSRNELTTIWNYWVSKRNLLKTQILTRDTKKQIDEINIYLGELNQHDKKLISKNRYVASKKYADKKAAEKQQQEQEEIEYKESLRNVAQELARHQQNKSEIRAQIKTTKNQITFLEEEMAKYADEIGLTALKVQLNHLEKTLSEPIKTSCNHRNKEERRSSISHGFGDFTRFWRCKDCGYNWDD
jgi:hypothetical protein